uniref:Uncharacterized protein LOC102805550 n=1 Tax=Saccoglossus kowalevskii TaxID=10224 RepID=A0ABM0MJD7_SACKO|nr:PREDICTED: uncharacterized protein LOC102805550 [Saccoglossus kowalevskii]
MGCFARIVKFGLLFLSCFLGNCSSQVTSDLKVYGLVVAVPDPANGQVSFTSGEDTFTQLKTVVINDGPDTLPGSSNGTYMYDFIVSLENSNTNLLYDVTLDIEMSETDEAKLSQQLALFASASYEPMNVTVTIPTDLCGNLAYLCITIKHNDDGGYVDDVSTNDYFCLSLVDGSSNAGIKECTPDLSPSSLNITDPGINLEYVLDNDVTITFDFNITNIGSEEINGTIDGSANYDFVASISDIDDLDDEDIHRITFNVDTSSAVGLTSGIPSSGVTTISGLKTDINIPTLNCGGYRYVCVMVTVPSGALYVDGDTDNNYFCLPFGDVEDGYAGVKPCSDSAFFVTTTPGQPTLPSTGTKGATARVTMVTAIASSIYMLTTMLTTNKVF